MSPYLALYGSYYFLDCLLCFGLLSAIDAATSRTGSNLSLMPLLPALRA